MAEKCANCGKTVYVVEKLSILNKTWHKWCFKCATCNMTLNMKNYAATGGIPYCKAHYPMPKASGEAEVAPPVDQQAYNRGNEDQTTGEAYGNSTNETYEYNNYGNNQGGGGGGYDDQQQGYDQQQGGYDDGQQQYYQ